MLKILETVPVNPGQTVQLPDVSAISQDILQHGTIYCIKRCFYPKPLDALRHTVFDYYKSRPTSYLERWEVQGNNFHCTRKGVAKKQKTLHYYHEYGFNDFDNLPALLKQPLYELFSSLCELHNRLTGQSRKLQQIDADGMRMHPALMHYFSGGGMFAAHGHFLEPQKIGVILEMSKRDRDYTEGAVGFETPDGAAIDTGLVSDIGDIVLFRYDLKHWVAPCDINSSLNEDNIAGRWSALIPIY